jgi:tetratricopeptide (TPR) repeat protein
MASDERSPEEKTQGRGEFTPAKRKRLEAQFETATRKVATAESAEDFTYPVELFAQCVTGDPGNLQYVQGYIEALQKKYKNKRKGGFFTQFQERGSRSAVKKAIAQEKWDEAIVHGLKVLAVNPWDVPTLSAMATAAVRSGDLECELYYLKSALVGNPKDPEINRMCARALTDRALFNQAIACWHRVEELLPNDEESKRAVSVIMEKKVRASSGFDDDGNVTRPRGKNQAQELVESPERKLQQKIQREPGNLENYLELAQHYITFERFKEAEEVLATAYEVSDGNIDIREKWEDAQLRHLRQRISRTPDPTAKAKLQREYFEKDLVACKNRVERYPGNLAFKFDLGYRYFLTERYHEAIRELQTAKNDPRRKGVSMLALGQCFQKIKQYSLAMRHYELAVNEIPDRDVDNKKRALYLAGRLAVSGRVNDLETAEKHLNTLASLDFTYKDVSALLDKVRHLRENPDSREAKGPGNGASDTEAENPEPPSSPSEE